MLEDKESQEELDRRGLDLALREAREAFSRDEVPVGAAVFRDGQFICRAHNQVEMLRDPTAHAEILAITQACAALESKWLAGCTLYVTLEPCAMCAGALVLARLERLVYGAADPKAGACGSVLDVIAEKKLNHRVEVTGGVMAAECGSLLSEFFRARR